MKIGVISDTHGRIDAWKKAEAIFTGADLIVHAGDVLYHPPRLGYTEGYDIPALVAALNNSPTPVVIAEGNCDAPVYEELLQIPIQKPFAFVEFEKTRIMVHHGHVYDWDQMIKLGQRYKVDVFITGHTHLPILERHDGLIMLNPGSPALPKYERDGIKIGSVAMITKKTVTIVSVDDGSTILEMTR